MKDDEDWEEPEELEIYEGRYWYRDENGDYCVMSTPAVLRMELNEDWTDYGAVMKEHPDLFIHDAATDKWTLTEKGEKANGDIIKGEFNAREIIRRYEYYKKFPEDRAGGEREFTAEELEARGMTLM